MVAAAVPTNTIVLLHTYTVVVSTVYRGGEDEPTVYCNILYEYTGIRFEIYLPIQTPSCSWSFVCFLCYFWVTYCLFPFK